MEIVNIFFSADPRGYEFTVSKPVTLCTLKVELDLRGCASAFLLCDGAKVAKTKNVDGTGRAWYSMLLNYHCLPGKSYCIFVHGSGEFVYTDKNNLKRPVGDIFTVQSKYYVGSSVQNNTYALNMKLLFEESP
eukprot:TRINITY_DN1925_c0_g1_i1.p1 TRINITY_DN1925_c0_g1~~TRINITY_DN1925_c0_g1_i1.p1  ORF type:complete len:133 (-),score=16.58 TRINITY_DN1925_c0_g1_i1:38-436(-)